eukprot:TRINITY_DN3239_c0_g3_i2.p1 TRINITY_DN3239_c0_g3~~TRINITY_DN3239_c0_g3_i2.p1  ORF type:complete len:351 (+),score=41.83 TRINITY_DN3239_c0_g3_i2:121-1173(+)
MIGIPGTASGDVRKMIDKYCYSQSSTLGHGQFGWVYKGVNTETGETVAIKVIELRTVLSNQLHSTLLSREIESLKLLRSPNIVRLEFCDGGDLQNLVMKKKIFTELEATEYLWQIGEAFKEMQRYNIAHRDLKPANILLHQGMLKVADLGFSKQLGEFKGEFTGTTLGTPLYMAPQILSKQPYTDKCDVWSFGVLAYQLVFGRFPWQGRDMMSQIREITSKPLALLPEVPLSYEYSDLLRRCLQVDERLRLSWQDVFVALGNLKAKNAAKALSGSGTRQTPEDAYQKPYSMQEFRDTKSHIPASQTPSHTSTNQLPIDPSAYRTTAKSSRGRSRSRSRSPMSKTKGPRGL